MIGSLWRENLQNTLKREIARTGNFKIKITMNEEKVL